MVILEAAVCGAVELYYIKLTDVAIVLLVVCPVYINESRLI